MSNMRSIRQVTPLSIALLGVIAAIISYQAAAYRTLPDQSANLPPTRFATFDLEKTFSTLEERKAASAEIVRIAEDMKKNTDKLAKDLKTMQAELDDLQAGGPKFKEQSEKIAQATYDYQAQIEFNRAKLDIERARLMKQVYMSIRKAAGQLAKERGLAAVFVDDSIAPIPPGTEEEINRQISGRRLVYASPEIDVTDELILRMNNAFKAAGPGK